ncbi:hypothetical protein Tco_0880818 [Tanacetum coccineum]
MFLDKPTHLWGSNATDVPSSSSLFDDWLSISFPDCIESTSERPVPTDNGYGDISKGTEYLKVYYVELVKDGLARGIPKLKFQKDHLCSACALGKSKKSSHQPKAEDTQTNQRETKLCHMNLCDHRVEEALTGKSISWVVMRKAKIEDGGASQGLEASSWYYK